MQLIVNFCFYFWSWWQLFILIYAAIDYFWMYHCNGQLFMNYQDLRLLYALLNIPYCNWLFFRYNSNWWPLHVLLTLTTFVCNITIVNFYMHYCNLQCMYDFSYWQLVYGQMELTAMHYCNWKLLYVSWATPTTSGNINIYKLYRLLCDERSSSDEIS